MINTDNLSSKIYLSYNWRKGHKYYNIHIHPNLFGGTSVVKSWGGDGGKSTSNKVIFCESESEVDKILRDVIKRRNLRGYRASTATNSYPTNELLEEVATSHINQLKQLIKPGGDINSKDDEGWTALKWAAYFCHTRIAELLILAGAKLDTCDKDGCTALMEAAWKGHLAIVRLLIKYGADVNSKSKESLTALMPATLGKHPEVVKLLIKAKASVREKDRKDRTVLEYAKASNCIKMLELISSHNYFGGIRQGLLCKLASEFYAF